MIAACLAPDRLLAFRAVLAGFGTVALERRSSLKAWAISGFATGRKPGSLLRLRPLFMRLLYHKYEQQDQHRPKAPSRLPGGEGTDLVTTAP